MNPAVERIGDYSVAVIPTPAVPEFWDSVATGFSAALHNSPGDTEFSDVIEALLEGSLGLVILADGEGPQAAACVEEISGARGNWLNLPFLWANGLAPLSRLFNFVEEYAYQHGYIGVKWVTTNDRAPVLAKRRGYQQRLVEYVKEFP